MRKMHPKHEEIKPINEMSTKRDYDDDRLKRISVSAVDGNDYLTRTFDIGCNLTDVQKLQQYLMEHYRILLWAPNPVMPEEEIPLDAIYVDPDIRVLRERCDQSPFKDVHQCPVSELSCKQIFQTGTYNCKDIYITGDAGTGKSMICQSVVNKWLKVNRDVNISDDEDSDIEESAWAGDFKYTGNRAWKKQKREERIEHKETDRSILKRFTLLFYITLKDALSECNITEMIQSQYLQHCADIEHLDAESILRKEKCLVILDGLDEWVSPEDKSLSPLPNPGIPVRDRLNKNVVILTTTRPWKLDVLRLKTSELDKLIELCGLGEKSAKRLSFKIVKMLNSSHSGSMPVSDFLLELDQKCLGHFKSNPVFLIQLICIWFDKKGISMSQVALYGSMLDLLLERAKEHLPYETHVSTQNCPIGLSLPRLFFEKNSCQLHKELLWCLSKLAFESLFNEKREQSLVFSSSSEELFGISQADIQLCLKCGILSQSKVFGHLSKRLKRLSFPHKKFQEFLAALYIATSDDQNEVVVRIKRICSTLDSCLEFSKVFMFVSGFNPERARDLLNHFSCKVKEDGRILAYRHTAAESGTIMPVVLDTQTCYVECLSECLTSGHSYDDLCPKVADFVVTRYTLRSELEVLVKMDSSNATSLYLDDNSNNKQQIIDIVLEQLHMLEKPTVYDRRNTITCSELQTVELNKVVLRSLQPFSTFTALQSLSLQNATIKHKHIDDLLAFISKHDLKDLTLGNLQCADHNRYTFFSGKYTHKASESCFSLDLQHLSNIQTLDISNMKLDNLHMLSDSVGSVVLSNVTVPVSSWRRFDQKLKDSPHQFVKKFWHRLGILGRWCNVSGDDDVIIIKLQLQYNERLSKFESVGEDFIAI